jgi:large subunit ribosomal protein L5
MPRIRDFRGLSEKGFDGRGGFSFGIKDHSIFPEIKHDERLSGNLGMDVSLSTTTECDGGAKDLLQKLGFPFL